MSRIHDALRRAGEADRKRRRPIAPVSPLSRVQGTRRNSEGIRWLSGLLVICLGAAVWFLWRSARPDATVAQSSASPTTATAPATTSPPPAPPPDSDSDSTPPSSTPPAPLVAVPAPTTPVPTTPALPAVQPSEPRRSEVARQPGPSPTPTTPTVQPPKPTPPPAAAIPDPPLSPMQQAPILVSTTLVVRPAPPEPTTSESAPTKSTAPAPPFPTLRLQSILFHPYRPQAMINGETVTPGESILGVQIVEILPEAVQVLYQGSNRVLELSVF